MNVNGYDNVQRIPVRDLRAGDLYLDEDDEGFYVVRNVEWSGPAWLTVWFTIGVGVSLDAEEEVYIYDRAASAAYDLREAALSGCAYYGGTDS
jgi:hypothetical protein